MRLTLTLACLLLAATASIAEAAGDASKAGTEAQGKAAGPTAEQKAEARKQSRSKWDTMTPEQKAEMKKRYPETRPERAAATGEKKERSRATPAADLPPPSAGPR
jgi:Sec-independent protein translocase protein TatA